jgi:hypothetical protein
MRKKRSEPGDVVEVAVDDRIGHIQYLGEHGRYGSAIRVAPGVRSAPPSDLSGLFERAYIAFYPVKTAIAQGLVKVVGSAPLGDVELPSRWRRAGARLEGQVETWIVEGPEGQSVHRSLTADQLKLPIGAIWNHEMLLERLRDAWIPEMER